MLCVSCKIEIPDGSNFCWDCGASQSGAEGRSSAPQNIERARVTFTDITGSKQADVTLRLSLTGDEVINRLIKNNFLTELEDGQVYSLHIQKTGRTIQPNQSLQIAGVEEGETIIAGIMTRGGGGIPIRSFREIQLVEAVLQQNNLIKQVNNVILFAVILYTDEDKNLVQYIREHINDLHSMSGQSCMFFVIEKPTDEWNLNIRKYLGALTGDYFDALWERLGTTSFKPFNKSNAYEIARHFGVKPNQLPSMVFFKNLQSKEALILELQRYVSAEQNESEYSKVFRTIFACVQDSVTLNKSSALENFKKQIHKELSKEKKKSTTEKQIETIKLSSSLIEIIGAVMKVFLP